MLEPSYTATFTSLMNKFMPQWHHFRDELNRAPLGHVDWKYWSVSEAANTFAGTYYETVYENPFSVCREYLLSLGYVIPKSQRVLQNVPTLAPERERLASSAGEVGSRKRQ